MTACLNNAIRMRIASCAQHLPVVRGAVEKLCEMMGFAAECTGGIVLSVDEALSNIIKHAYGGASDQPIEIELAAMAEPPGLCVKMRDWGRSVDPAKIRSRDLDDVRPGGLGVHIMNQCMDRVEYGPAEGGGTVLTMVKYRSPRPQEQTR